MRFAIISDIHANLPALEAVIGDIASEEVQCVVCLGDIVGYGPFPAECLRRVRKVTNYVVMGNHEAATTGLFDVDLFQAEAKEHILWTRNQLSEDEIGYMADLPYMLDFKDFLIVHGGLPNPDAFPYAETREEALETFTHTDAKLLFVGHTHIPVIHRVNLDGEYAAIEKNEARLNPKWRYIVNAGAVGLSRDNVFSAGYAVYDSEEHSVRLKRVKYNLKPLYDAIHAMARDSNHLNALMKRFRPPNIIRMDKTSPNKISKSILRDAVEKYKKTHRSG